MFFEDLCFGSITVDGVRYNHDLILDRGKIQKRKKGPSREFRTQSGHTPLTTHEEIPWRCRRLIVGTGIHGRLPVSPDVQHEARRRNIELLMVPTDQAVALLNEQPSHTNAVLHLTC